MTAPESRRTHVNVAASMPETESAARQSSELPANAISVSDVSRTSLRSVLILFGAGRVRAE